MFIKIICTFESNSFPNHMCAVHYCLIYLVVFFWRIKTLKWHVRLVRSKSIYFYDYWAANIICLIMLLIIQLTWKVHHWLTIEVNWQAKFHHLNHHMFGAQHQYCNSQKDRMSVSYRIKMYVLECLNFESVVYKTHYHCELRVWVSVRAHIRSARSESDGSSGVNLQNNS